LNARYRAETDGTTAQQPGVVVRPFATDEVTQMWTPCNDCTAQSDRVSGSLINSRLFEIGGEAGAGFVLSLSENELLCSWAVSGVATDDIVCHPQGASAYCVPGCISGQIAYPGDPGSWCETFPPSWSAEMCPWGPGRLSDMVKQHEEQRNAGKGPVHNEVIMDRMRYMASMPYSIEAFYFTADTTANTAWNAHQAFLSEYGVSEDEIPLIRLDLSRDTDPFQPCKCDRDGHCQS